MKQYRIQRHNNGDYHFERVGERPSRQHISTRAVDKALRRACDLLGLEGAKPTTLKLSLSALLVRD